MNRTLFGAALVSLLLPAMERRLLATPALAVLLPLAIAAAAYFFQQARQDEDHDRFLIYEDRPEAAVTVIRLAD